MALRLRQLKKTTGEDDKASRELAPKKKALRPWESYDKFETKVRTKAARKAVEKAQQRLNKNPIYFAKQKPLSPEEVALEHDAFYGISKDLSPPGIWGLIKYILRI